MWRYGVITEDQSINCTWYTIQQCFFSLISTVKGILLIVESPSNLTVLPADVRVEAVFVLGDVRTLWTLEPHASHHMQVLHVAGDASLGHHLVARVAHETPICLGDVFIDERILN